MDHPLPSILNWLQEKPVEVTRDLGRGSSPCFRIYPPTIYAYAAPVPGVVAPVYRESTLWWPGYYNYAPVNGGVGFPGMAATAGVPDITATKGDEGA